jgi:chromosome segregation ATPase
VVQASWKSRTTSARKAKRHLGNEHGDVETLGMIFLLKKTMDNMLAELKTQQKNEYDQNERCKKDIDEIEDTIKIEQRNKKDLEDKNKDLTNILATLNDEIKTLKQEVSDMEVSLKKAGVDRKAENELNWRLMVIDNVHREEVELEADENKAQENVWRIRELVHRKHRDRWPPLPKRRSTLQRLSSPLSRPKNLSSPMVKCLRALKVPSLVCMLMFDFYAMAPVHCTSEDFARH